MRTSTRNILKITAPAALALGFVASPALAGPIIYDSLDHPMPVNGPSQAYQAQQVSEFGDAINFAGSNRNLASVTLTLSDWAKHSDWSSYDSSGWSHPLTLTLYNVNNSDSTPAVGSQIASRTISPEISWRPESDGCGGDSTAFTGSDDSCNHGLAQNVTFDFNGVTVPDQIIYGLSFNTETYGGTPTGTDGPYDSLNFLVNGNSTPSVGTEVSSGDVFINSDSNAFTTGTVGTFSQTSYSGYIPAAQFQAVPEPSALAMLGFGLIGIGFLARRQHSREE